MAAIQPQVDLRINQRFLAQRFGCAENQPMVNKVSTLWTEIAEALEAKRKTQTWLANELGLSDNAITKWKKTGQITIDNAKRVSELLDIPIERLLTGASNPVVEALRSLPIDRSKAIVTQVMYQIEHAEDVLTGDQISHYLKAMASFVKDMERRKGK